MSNLYEYCENDPINRIDLDGLQSLLDFRDFAAGVVDALVLGYGEEVFSIFGQYGKHNCCSKYFRGGQIYAAVVDLAVGAKAFVNTGKLILKAVYKAPKLLEVAAKSIAKGPQRKQLLNLFKGVFRIEKGVESIPRNIQKVLGVKIPGAIQKPWHMVIFGKEIPLNPFNPLWIFFP